MTARRLTEDERIIYNRIKRRGPSNPDAYRIPPIRCNEGDTLWRKHGKNWSNVGVLIHGKMYSLDKKGGERALVEPIEGDIIQRLPSPGSSPQHVQHIGTFWRHMWLIPALLLKPGEQLVEPYELGDVLNVHLYPEGQILRHGPYLVVSVIHSKKPTTKSTGFRPLSDDELVIYDRIESREPTSPDEYRLPPVHYMNGDTLWQELDGHWHQVGIAASGNMYTIKSFNKGRKYIIIRPVDGDVLKRPPHQGAPVEQHIVIATYWRHIWLVPALLPKAGEDRKIVQSVHVIGTADSDDLNILWLIVNVTEADLLMGIVENVEAGADRETSRDLENVVDEDAVPGADRYLESVEEVDATPGVAADICRDQALLAEFWKMQDRVSQILLHWPRC
ncbi:uncharacterized protein LOC117174535 [Belonocnema kinseyi]|uniref:uncharacterized protein LOC117174535 n=1 Tax=Belonocnema kinseyi TaxID=2817044 RepID=UPI00143CDC46|nr:uncharacterized protein LOC117174535 [Belonocnema kinseyi]